jgi:formylglycine-generating enzyme required for sulfatase activity
MRAPILALALLLAGCPAGIDPPAATPMIRIAGGTFTLGERSAEGHPTACGASSASKELERCDSLKHSSQTLNPVTDKETLIAWIDEISWTPAATAMIGDFEIDEHEVTNAQYAHCVALGACTPPLQTAVQNAEGTVTPYHGSPEFDDAPVVFVTHQQAAAYCAFKGKTLPTEAQWERAARSSGKPGDPPRVFPWTDTLDNSCEEGTPRYLVTKGCKKSPQPVRSSERDRTATGVRNMAANVAEWVLDGWHRYAYCVNREGLPETCQLGGPTCVECNAQQGCGRSCSYPLFPAGVSYVAICKPGVYTPFTGNNAEWVVRGGSWLESDCMTRLFVRRKGTSARQEIGFRCAR